MTYVDGVVIAVPTANKNIYRSYAVEAAALFKDLGALSVVECWGDEIPEGKINSLHTAVLREPDETIVFSWIAWPTKQARDAAWAKIRSGEVKMSSDMSNMPFDGSRMIFGGFDVLLEA